jgi:hypothetical protein
MPAHVGGTTDSDELYSLKVRVGAGEENIGMPSTFLSVGETSRRKSLTRE